MKIPACELLIGDVLISPGFAVTVTSVEYDDDKVRVRADDFTLLYDNDELVETK